MVKVFKKKAKNSNYFSLQALLSTTFWALFLLLFYFLGKSCLESDILGKIYHSILRKEKNFSQYFLGEGVKEKSQLLTYAIYFIIAIIILNILSILIN